MTKTVFNYKGYHGSADVSPEDKCLYGKILFITDLVNYRADTYTDLEKEFKSAVDDYLEICDEIGVSPKKSCNGVFNVRIRPDLHEKLVYQVAVEGIKQNAIVAKAIEEYITKESKTSSEIHNHYHQHVNYSVEMKKPELTKEQPSEQVFTFSKIKLGEGTSSFH